jgi:hypothetical protein
VPPEKPQAREEQQEQQDQSIKARKRQLFEEPQEPEVVETVKPFAEYVRDTPPAPMPKGLKVTLWVVGVLTVLLFLAAVTGVGRRHRSTRARRAAWEPGAAQPAARAAIVPLASGGASWAQGGRPQTRLEGVPRG